MAILGGSLRGVVFLRENDYARGEGQFSLEVREDFLRGLFQIQAELSPFGHLRFH